MFLKSDSVTTVPRFPRPGPPEAAFPDVISTIRALRLPAPSTRLLMNLLPRSRFCSPRSLLCGAEHPRRPGPALSRGTISYSKQVEHRSSQVPGESIPCLCPALGSRPVRPGLTFSDHTVQSPPLGKRRHPPCGHFGTQSRGFDIRCLRFKSCVTARACKARFRWVVSPCREGVEPSGLHRKVSDFLLPPFPGLSWRDPK